MRLMYCFLWLLSFSFLPSVAQQVPDGRAGLAVSDATEALRKKHRLLLKSGAVVTKIDRAGPAAKARLRVGDVILEANDATIAGRASFQALVAKLKPQSKLRLIILRRSRVRALSLTLPQAKTKQPTKLAKQSAPAQPDKLAAPPFMMLDTGGHMALIRDVVFTPDGKHLVSASDDKTIRIWDVASGQTVRTIRGQVTRTSGEVYAISLSSDGKMLAVGGYFAPRSGDVDVNVGVIRLYDFETGKLLGLLKGHTKSVFDLAFSQRGDLLVSGSSDRTAIVWDVRKRQLKHRLKGHRAEIYAVAISPDGERIVTGSFDRQVRIWSTDRGRQLKRLRGHDVAVYSVAMAPNGTIASGDVSGRILLWDSGSSKPTRVLVEQQSRGIGALAFSSNSKLLLSTALSGVGARSNSVWNVETGDPVATYLGHNDNVRAAAISPDGQWAVTGGGSDNEIHIWDVQTGQPRQKPDGLRLGLNGHGKSICTVGITADGGTIAWGYDQVETTDTVVNPYQFSLRLPSDNRKLGSPQAVSPDSALTLTSAARDHGELSIRHRKGGDHDYKNATLEILRNDVVRATVTRTALDGYGHISYGLTEDQSTIISGGFNGQLLAYDLKGTKLGRFFGHTGSVCAIAPSADGRYLVSGSNDQTIRLWNLKSRELIVTLFHGRDGNWVMWTPQGYYTGSPGGGALVGWQLNKGKSEAADYVRGQQLRRTLFRPDIVERALVLTSAKAAVQEAGLVGLTVDAILNRRQPPVIRVAGPESANGGRSVITVTFDKPPQGDDRIDVFVGNAEQESKVAARPVKLPPGLPRKAPASLMRAYEVPLFRGANLVRVVAANSTGESEPQWLDVLHNGEGELDKRGTLWVLAVGVDKYPGLGNSCGDDQRSTCDLSYAGVDATAFAKAAAKEMKSTHRQVKVTVLVNGRGETTVPTRKNILSAIERIKTKSTANDTVVIFLAGHGVNAKGGRYLFLPSDVLREGEEIAKRSSIDWQSEIQQAITQAKGRRLMFVDACHSGSAHNRKLLSDALTDRFVAFAATNADQGAWELKELGHGAFTKVLLDGIGGKAIDPRQRAVTVYRLGTYLNEEVQRYTNGQQSPEYQSGQGNFILARD
ncbi:MAG: PDZ domain-containing protein, partial [Hyphomicrobiaceae bacterium]